MNSLKSKVYKTLLDLNRKPSKALGQNFLISENVVKFIVDQVIYEHNKLKPECILEIGAGLGIIIERILPLKANIFGIELDRKLAEYLKNKFKGTNAQILNIDFLKLDISKFSRSIVFGNIPYNISSKVLEKLCLFQKNVCFSLLMLQKEFAQRLLIKNYTERSRLSILVNLYFNVSKKKEISRECFWPKPKVESILLELRPRFIKNFKSFGIIHQTLKACFSKKRKTLKNNLKSFNAPFKEEILSFLAGNNLLDKRPEDIDLQIWEELFSN